MPSDLPREDDNLRERASIPIAVSSVWHGTLSFLKEQLFEFCSDDTCDDPIDSLFLRQPGLIAESIAFTPDSIVTIGTHLDFSDLS
jgi:hypothetical protein